MEYGFQHRYILETLKWFNMENCKLAKIPKDPEIILQVDMKSPPTNVEVYKVIIECIYWISTIDYNINYASNYDSKYASKPKEVHLDVAKSIMDYLKRTLNYVILFVKNQERWFLTYIDSGYGRDLDTRRSTLGMLYKIGDALKVWNNKLQPIIFLSTTKVKY